MNLHCCLKLYTVYCFIQTYQKATFWKKKWTCLGRYTSSLSIRYYRDHLIVHRDRDNGSEKPVHSSASLLYARRIPTLSYRPSALKNCENCSLLSEKTKITEKYVVTTFLYFIHVIIIIDVCTKREKKNKIKSRHRVPQR